MNDCGAVTVVFYLLNFLAFLPVHAGTCFRPLGDPEQKKPGRQIGLGANKSSAASQIIIILSPQRCNVVILIIVISICVVFRHSAHSLLFRSWWI